MYDAIVVGARAAGSPTALLLARAGHRVLLVDKARFPSDTMSTHFLAVSAVAQLDRWGLLEAVANSGCPPIEKIQWTFEGTYFESPFLPAGDIRRGYAPRRYILDEILVRGAEAAGAELREGCRVDGLIFEGDRVVGLRGRGEDGATFEERARIVVGADGRNSTVAKQVAASSYHESEPFTFIYYSYFSGIESDAIEVYNDPGVGIVVFPTHNDHVAISVSRKREGFKDFKRDIEGNFAESVSRYPRLAERFVDAKREEPFSGTAALPHFLRVPCGPGWALVGDAGLYRDPLGGPGIPDAFRDAEALAGAIDSGLRGAEPLEAALGRFHQERDAVATPVLDLIAQIAALDPAPPPMKALIECFPNNPAAAAGFVGTVSRTVSIPEYFAPANLESMIRAAT